MSLTELGTVEDVADPLTTGFSASYAGVMAFIAVAHEGSFSRAADRLGIGRSAVSRSVQKLEGQLGVRLFLRTTRSTSLTREGELFHDGCRRAWTASCRRWRKCATCAMVHRAGTCGSARTTALAVR